MSRSALQTLIISDFTVDQLAGYLQNDKSTPALEVAAAPFGEVASLLTNPHAECWKKQYDCLVLWTRPENVSVSFRKLLNFETVNHADILAEVDEFIQLIRNNLSRAKTIIIPSWIIPAYQRGYGALDMNFDQGIANALMRMNLRLTEALSAVGQVYFCNMTAVAAQAGAAAFNPKLWYLGKIPFSPEVFKFTARDIKAVLRAVYGLTKKLVIVDLDDTLWGGVVGEEGSEQLKLGGHDPLGEAFVDFQKALLGLTRRGILLSIVSKNDEATALDVIENHPEMILRKQHFAGWRINWNDKAENVADLLKEFNLGAEAAVFIDDDPAQRSRVREALPQVFVPEWPADKMLYAKTFLEMDCFDQARLTKEDAQRSLMYAAETRRKEFQQEVLSYNDWLRGLQMTVTVEELNPANLALAAQLLNKTNQLNLQTRRLTESEFGQWAQGPARKVWTFRVSDKFGDSGLAGLASVEIKDQQALLVDLVLSCRVFGRMVEETMTAVAVEHARACLAGQLCAAYVPTEKNKPCLEFLERSSLARHSDGRTFVWDCRRAYPFPAELTIKKNYDYSRTA